MKESWLDSLSFDHYTLHYTTARPALKTETEEWIIHGLIKAMPTLKIEDHFKAKKSWFTGDDYLIVAVDDNTDELIAVLASRWYETDGSPFFLHITFQMITSRYQRTYLIKHMWGFHFQKVSQGRFGFPSILALRTYNPVAFSAMRIFTRIEGVWLYPQIGVAMQDPLMVELARRVAERISPGLEICLHTGVLKGAGVPADLYTSLPKMKKSEVYKYFEDNLTPADRLLCILSIPTVSAKNKILRAFGVER